jgi:hypothetical protein
MALSAVGCGLDTGATASTGGVCASSIGIIHGRVLVAQRNNAPSMSATVSVMPAGTLTLEQQVVVDAQGSYELKLRPGDWSLSAQDDDEGCLMSMAQSVTAVACEDREQDLMLDLCAN